MNRRRLAAALVAVLIGFTACGGGSDEGTSGGAAPATEVRDLLLASAEKAAEVTTTHFEFTTELPGPGGSPLTVTGTGAVDNSVPLVTMVMDGAGLIPGAGAGDTSMEFIFDGEAFYMRFPESIRSALGGKEWVKLASETLSGQSGFDFDQLLAQFRSSDPLANLSLLGGAGGDAVEVGTETVRGVETRHFTVTVDVRESLEDTPAEVRPALEELIEQLGTTALPVDVWIAEDGLPRRFSYSVDLSSADVPETEGLSGVMTTTIEMFDFGEPVEITVPAPDDTADLADLIGRSGGY